MIRFKKTNRYYDCMDVTELTRLLIQENSITPSSGRCFDIIERFLAPLGFTFHHLNCGQVSNLYARRGTTGPHLCWAGHVDVVPIQAGWSHPPFEGVIVNERLIGRGVTDMKGAIAAMLCAVRDTPTNHGSSSFIFTSDEEGPAQHGTQHVVQWLKAHNEKIDHTIIGEPTNPNTMGSMIKVGRRGSLNVEVHAQGTSGHVAYPQWTDNPLSHLVPLLHQLQQYHWDDGMEFFDPTHLEVVSITCPHQASNLIASKASAWINIRHNPLWTCAQLTEAMKQMTYDPTISWTIHSQSEPFVGADQHLIHVLQKALPEATLSTSGGISDARFIRELCPVAEYGLLSDTAHKIDESVPVSALHELKQTYSDIIRIYFDE